ncbi:MAG TPA: acyltransferase [Vicinamibacterales bacterium]|nr:acyltransferase [Vicinamibacterales bacterium]
MSPLATTPDPALPPPARLTHMVQLDGLRAIAVSAVLFHHYSINYLSHAYGDAAGAGVKLFFVLSGFLITGILLVARDQVERGALNSRDALRRFYVRRVLRIFPVYYGVVVVALIFQIGPARDLVWWLLTYTLNLKMGAQGWYESTFAHFWSLNVEEQFYLFWPWVILFMPRRWLTRATIGMILVSPLGKLVYVLSDYSWGTNLETYISTWASLDSLGIGALIAVLRHRGAGITAPRSVAATATAIIAAGPWLAVVFRHGVAEVILASTAQAAVFGWVILRAADGFKGPVGALLRSPPMVFVGRISYGIYVYHLFVPRTLVYFLYETAARRYSYGWRGAVAATVGTLALASLSWFLMEKPINRLKDRFR